MSTNQILTASPLGKKSSYIDQYDPSLLFPVPRKPKRDEIGIGEKLPFSGWDIWTGFEVSWLNLKGKPEVAILESYFPCESPFLAESKSQKLYLNSFNNSKFESFEEVRKLIQKDLSNICKAPVEVKLSPLNQVENRVEVLNGDCLDSLDVACTEYQPNPQYLSSSISVVSEVLHTNLLKSNCLVTGQPDWGSVEISYFGGQIDRAGLLKYIVSLRNHNEFHEQCVERIFSDIMTQCRPERLTVYARYTRRGGLDINPFRTNDPDAKRPDNIRLVRQ